VKQQTASLRYAALAQFSHAISQNFKTYLGSVVLSFRLIP
jgi:hypothetical protein